MPSRSNRRLAALLALVIAVTFAVACATTVTQEDVKAQLREAGQPFARIGPQRIIPIYAESRIVAVGLLAEARNDPSSQLSTRLSRRLVLAHKRRQHVVVGGPYPGLSDTVLANALALGDGGELRGLKVIFVSEDAPSKELASAASTAHARLYHRTPR